MRTVRKLLGILVMAAGVLGLVLSLAGLVGVWWLKPVLVQSATTTIDSLNTSIGASKDVMRITAEALGATVASVDALSDMLGTTADTIEDTQPVFTQVNTVMGETVPATLEEANASLKTAQDAAAVLESSMKSLDNFRLALSAAPFFGALVDQPDVTYNPEVPLAESLGEVADSLESLPATFETMSANIDQADDNLALVQANLNTMSSSVALISASLSEYEAMVTQSQSSMDNLQAMLTSLQANLAGAATGAAAVLTLFFFWLLAAQIVIFSQGWELFQGTASRMEGAPQEESQPAPPTRIAPA